MKTPQLLVLLAGLAIAVAGCGTETQQTAPADPGPQQSDKNLQGRTFLTTEVTENGKPRELVADSRVSLEFTKDGELVADAGCNAMRGEVDLSDQRIVAPSLLGTEMACMPRALMEQETWLTDVIDAKPSWRFEQENLVVETDSTTMVMADREQVEPDLPLEGTKWQVDSVTESMGGEGGGDSAVSATGAGNGKAWLKFTGSKVEGFGGCNSFSGTAKVAGDSIEFEPIVATRRACADPSLTETETKLLAVLDGKVSYEIDTTRLTLSNSGGDGLTLTGKR